MNWVEIVGYLASGFVFCTFYMKTMVPLRCIAICSNVAFMTYGYFGNLYPVLVLHMALFPLNVTRLLEMRKLIRQVRVAAQGDLSMEWLLPFMTKRPFKQGDVLLRKGDLAHETYYILHGTVRLEEVGVDMGSGHLVGEIGVFSPRKERTRTAVCQTDGEMLAITDEKVMQLYYQNPQFGFYLVQLITKRLIDDISRWEAAVAEREVPPPA